MKKKVTSLQGKSHELKRVHKKGSFRVWIDKAHNFVRIVKKTPNGNDVVIEVRDGGQLVDSVLIVDTRTSKIVAGNSTIHG